MKTAVIYARYSSDSQTEQSIEGQVRVCKDFAARNDLVIVDSYIDRAMTGTNDKREAFQKMLRDSEKHQWSVVLVYKLDRFSRNKYESVIHKKTLKDNGVKLISAMENIPDTPEGILMESLLEGFNQYYSEELRQKVNRGLRESWLKGNATGGRHIFGYDIINKKYVINEHESKIIVRVFEQYAKGFKAREIAEELNNQGFTRPNGELFNEKFIYFILHNERYTGKVKHKDEIFENIFPRIINDNLWQQVDSINQDNKNAPSTKKAIYNYILTGKLICGQCNHKMCGVSGNSRYSGTYYYYTCLQHKNKTNPCSTKQVGKEYLENLVIEAVQRALYSETNIEFIVTKMYDLLQNKVSDQTTLNLLNRQYKDTSKALDNLIKALEQGIVSEHTKTRLTVLEQELIDLEIKINHEKNKTYCDLTKDKIEKYIRSHLFDNFHDIKIRKALINGLVKEIRLYPDKMIILFNITEKLATDNLSVGENIKTESLINAALANIDSSYILPYTLPAQT